MLINIFFYIWENKKKERRLIMKKALFICALASLVIPTVVSATSTNSTSLADPTIIESKSHSSETIPASMEPGVVIEYDENNKMHIVHKPNLEDFYVEVEDLEQVKSNTAKNNNTLKLEDNAIVPNFENEKLFLPKPQPGMRVAYDGQGLPAFIKVNGEVYYGDNNKQMSAPVIRNQYVYGNITWYDDAIGQEKHKLGPKDCATKKGYDEPDVGTPIIVTKTDDGKTDTLTKWDVGTLPNAILDIRLEEMRDYFNVPAGYKTKNGKKISYGSFQGKYIHK